MTNEERWSPPYFYVGLYEEEAAAGRRQRIRRRAERIAAIRQQREGREPPHFEDYLERQGASHVPPALSNLRLSELHNQTATGAAQLQQQYLSTLAAERRRATFWDGVATAAATFLR